MGADLRQVLDLLRREAGEERRIVGIEEVLYRSRRVIGVVGCHFFAPGPVCEPSPGVNGLNHHAPPRRPTLLPAPTACASRGPTPPLDTCPLVAWVQLAGAPHPRAKRVSSGPRR